MCLTDDIVEAQYCVIIKLEIITAEEGLCGQNVLFGH